MNQSKVKLRRRFELLNLDFPIKINGEVNLRSRRLLRLTRSAHARVKDERSAHAFCKC